MTGYAFHPEARRDLEEIWEFMPRIVSTPPIGWFERFLPEWKTYFLFQIKDTSART